MSTRKSMALLLYFFFLQAPFTGGEDGLQSVPRGSFLGLSLDNDLVLFYVVLFSIPRAQEKFFLDISDPETVGIGFAFGALAIVMVEVFRRVAPSLFRAVAHRRA